MKEFDIRGLEEVAKALEKDKVVVKRVEEFRRRHGTPKQKDLTKVFTV